MTVRTPRAAAALATLRAPPAVAGTVRAAENAPARAAATPDRVSPAGAYSSRWRPPRRAPSRTTCTTGVLESEAQADISPQASGTVTRIYVEEGDTVSRGQLLASIDNVSLNAGADRATIELEKARQSLREAESLHSRGAISNRELRDAQDAVRIARPATASPALARASPA